MAKLAVIDMRRVIGVLERLPADARTRAARDLRAALVGLGIYTVGEEDENLGCDAQQFNRRIGSTVAVLRKMEKDDYVPPDVREQFGRDFGRREHGNDAPPPAPRPRGA